MDVCLMLWCMRFECGCEDRFQSLLCFLDKALVTGFFAKHCLAC